MRPADGSGGFLPDPVDIHHDTQAETRRRVALSTHDIHIFSQCIQEHCDLPTFFKDSAMWPGCATPAPFSVSIYLFIYLPTFVVVLEVKGLHG